jgi:uncharacterized membrane protein
MLAHILLFLHISSVIVWVGGMVFAYFCLRPAAAQQLQPPQRLPLWVAAFQPFFRMVAIAVALILASGFGMFFRAGARGAPLGWSVMMALGLVMSAVFAYIYAMLYPDLRRQAAASAWPAAAGVLNRIRQLVAVNLVLAALTVAAAVASR